MSSGNLFSLADPKRVGLYLPPGSSSPATNENLQRNMPVISLTKQEMNALNALQNHFITNEDCEFALIGNTETVENDTSYAGNFIKDETVKHYSSESQHALGYKNYSELSQHLKNAVDAINNLKIRARVPDDKQLVQMLHVVACITPLAANDLIKNGYGFHVVFNYKNQNIIVRIYGEQDERSFIPFFSRSAFTSDKSNGHWYRYVRSTSIEKFAK